MDLFFLFFSTSGFNNNDSPESIKRKAVEGAMFPIGVSSSTPALGNHIWSNVGNKPVDNPTKVKVANRETIKLITTAKKKSCLFSVLFISKNKEKSIKMKHEAVLGAIGMKFSPKLANILAPVNQPVRLINGKKNDPIIKNIATV